jgi:glyoxylase-like metal-dependent hydrolase (beta-lactamase superfamily II)
MLRELVSKNIFVFTSELYAQVTASAILTSAGAIVIDTLAYPAETRQIVRFIEERHNTPVRYVINTHYHADHTYGTCFFKDVIVVSHRLCRELLDGPGREALERAQQNAREMSAISIRLPDVMFNEGCMSLHLGGVTLRMWHTPGHSMDSIVCLHEQERILFAADTLMPVPFFADGSWEAYVKTLESLNAEAYECIVQGHGEVILRGEAQARLDEDLKYLHAVRRRVEKIVDVGKGPEALANITLEQCGKDRVALNGLVQQLHQSNLQALYWQLREEKAGPETL